MFDQSLGTQETIGGRSYISTKLGVVGHAVWGSQVRLQRGRYCVIIDISLSGEVNDPLAREYGYIEVVADGGANIIARTPITAEQLASSDRFIKVEFELTRQSVVETRAYVYGNQVLLIGENPRPITLSHLQSEDEAIIAKTRFPDLRGRPTPAFFRANIDRLRELHQQNRVLIDIKGDDVILGVDGLRFHARELNDIVCLKEIFVSNIYNIVLPRKTCVIDIGMNVGFATIFFASRENVTEVHSFEPFDRPFQGAKDNLNLNPVLKDRVILNRIALSNRTETKAIQIGNKTTTARLSIRDQKIGQSVTITVHDAASELGPIIDRAISNGSNVIAKIDCEGSEYEIFKSLEKAGLLQKFSALIVEWHPYSVYSEFSDLAKPLLGLGFVIIDRTLRKDRANGIFYAVNLG